MFIFSKLNTFELSQNLDEAVKILENFLKENNSKIADNLLSELKENKSWRETFYKIYD